MKRIIHEAHRRSLWQVLGIYLMGSWIVLQVIDQLHETAGLPDWVPSLALVLLLIGLPMVLATAFVQEGLPGHTHAPEMEPEGDPSAAADAESAPPFRRRGNVLTWRHAMVGGIAALALFGAATAAWMVMRSAGIGTAGTLVARGLIEDGERVVLADFSGDSALAIAATAALRVQLGESGVVSVAEPSLVAGVLKRMGVAGGPVDFERAAEVAEREGFKAVVDGSVVPAGEGYILTARVIETATGTELVSVGETASDASSFLSAVDQLGRKLRERLGDSLGSIRETAPLERATTTSLEALRKYTRGVDAFNARDDDQAIALLEEAIALDSSFAMAWRKLAAADGSRRATAAIRAYELRDRLTERERYHTIGAYHVFATLDYDAAVVTYRRLVEAYPDDTVGLYNLAWAYLQLGRADLAVEIFGRSAAADPYSPGAYRSLIPVLRQVGLVDSARAVLRSYSGDFPDHPDGPGFRSLFAYMDGDIAEAEAEIEPLLRNEAGSVQRDASRRLVDLKTVSGQLEDARALRMRSGAGAANPLGEALWEVSIDLGVRKDTSAAIDRLRAALDAASDRAVDRNSDPLSRLFYATGDVELGDLYHERQMVRDSLEDAILAAPRKQIDELKHRIRRSLAVGDWEDVIEASRELGSVYPYRDPAEWAHRAIPAFEALGQADSVIAHYDAWIGRREGFRRVLTDSYILPHAYERLGQLYDARGDLENAALYYAQFVDLWKDADPDLQPRVTAARERLDEIMRERG